MILLRFLTFHPESRYVVQSIQYRQGM